MRFFRACSPSRPAFRLGGPLGERKVTVRLNQDQLQLSLATGETLEVHALETASWHACVLPNKEHALCLRVPARPSSHTGVTRELLLRSKAKEKVEELQEQLRAAGVKQEQLHQQGAMQQRSAEVSRTTPCRLPEEHAGHELSSSCCRGGAQPQRGRPHLKAGTAASQHQRIHLAATPGLPPTGSNEQAVELSSVSFGSPVAEEIGELEADDFDASNGQPAVDACSAGNDGAETPSENGSQPGDETGAYRWQELDCLLPSGSASPALLKVAQSELPRPASAPASPILPGLPLVASPKAALARHPSISAPVSPVHAKASASRDCITAAPAVGALINHALQLPQPPPVQPPVRLLSFSGRSSCTPAAQSHVQRLEAAVAHLTLELAQTRSVMGSTGGEPLRRKAAAGDATAGVSPNQPTPASQTASRSSIPLHHLAQVGADKGVTTTAGNVSDLQALSKTTSGHQLELVLQENALLLGHQAALQAELGRMQVQLSAAAADNIRLAQQAAAAVRQLQAAEEAARCRQLGEQQLRISLGDAVGQCEAVGRELAVLSGKLEAKTAHYQELRTATEALLDEKTLLTAALTTAQLQLREATPAGWAAQEAEMRHQADAVRSEAAKAREVAAGAEAKVAEAKRREAEAAGHMREAARCLEDAQAARAAGLEREQQLAAEIRTLRQQLAGRLPEGDPARALQERGALLGQVQQLQAVGQELSSSCRVMEAGMQAAVRERDGLQAALSQAQAAHAAAEKTWQQQRQQLESSLGAASGRLAGSEDSVQTSRAQTVTLQTQVESLQRDLSAASAREQELQAELKLLAAKAEAESKAGKERAEAAAAAHTAEAARLQDQLLAKESELAAARKEAALLEAEQQRLQDDVRRGREERAVAARDLQLEASSAKAEAAALAQDLHSARSGTEELRRALEETKQALQQAQAQAAAAATTHSTLSTERKELQAQVERLGVERDRAQRDSEAHQLKCAALQQQCKLLEAVAHGQATLGGRGTGGSPSRARRAASKENGGGLGVLLSGGGLIRAHRFGPYSYSSGSD